MTRASSMETAAPDSATRSTTLTIGSSAGWSTVCVSTAPGLAATAAVATFGRTVTMPRPAVKPDDVSSLPPNTLISIVGPVSDHETAVALVRTPSPVRAETAPATSRPSGPAPTKIASGAASPSASRAMCRAAAADHA